MENINPIILKGSTRLTCENCGGIFFKQVVLFHSISKFKVGATEDVVIPLSVSRCDDCGMPIQAELKHIDELVKVEEIGAAADSIKPRNSGLILT